jgi:outer membrane protein
MRRNAIASIEAALVRAYQNNPQLNAQRASLRSTETYRSFGAAEISQLSVPIYQGGVEYSLIRQSKESRAQQRLNLDQTRDQVRANTIAAWGQLIASKAQVASAQAQVTASKTAFNDVREEAKAGQRTTLDVLHAQQALVNARVALVTAGAQSCNHRLRSERALSAGARQLVGSRSCCID